jgi:single-stranded-DNA-specific exonuclease
MPIPLKKYWEIIPPPPPEVVKGLADYSSNMQQFLYNRHIETEAAAHNYLNVSGPIHNPYDLSGMQAAVDRIIYAIVHHESVVVYGDYDVDGVTATALLTQLLKQLGADVHEYFPDRFEEGYGVNSNALENLHENGVRLVITVDCGARSCCEAERARQIGLDLIITDHHEPEHELPIAHAIICHRQPGDNYPDKNLAGVGLAFKLAQALLEKYPFSGCSMDDFYDLVAIGTVADVVPLIGENRSLVKAGLHKIRTHPRQGLFSLSRVAGIPVGRCTSRDIGRTTRNCPGCLSYDPGGR